MPAVCDFYPFISSFKALDNAGSSKDWLAFMEAQMASAMEMDSKVLVLDEGQLRRECPSRALQPLGLPRLVVLSAPLRGKELVLEPRQSQAIWTLGSGAGADFVILDATLRAIHLFVERVGDDWLLSSHPDCWGFHVNDEPVETAVVEHGDRVVVGRLEMVFVGGQESAEVEPAVSADTRKWWRRFRRVS
ncbi:MAG: FHA domain-containing protein [Gammaproteobacteria bacterium]